MSKQWFRLSLDDGLLEESREPKGSKPVPWIERDVENLFALNPNLLALDRWRPVRLRGIRKTVSSPDQAYIGLMGRVAVVEFKKVEASFPAVAQAIAYADHWRLLPPGEVDPHLAVFANGESRAAVFGGALAEVQRWAGARATANLLSLGQRVLARLPKEPFGEWAGPKPFASGLPPRMIVVAPAFGDECVKFGFELAKRKSSIELVEVDVRRSGGDRYVGVEWIVRDPIIEPTWELFQEVYRDPIIRSGFDLNGWADALNLDAFSLSSKTNTEVKFWLWASTEEKLQTVFTTVPDRWFANDRIQRNRLRKEFLQALPKGCDPSKRWLEWDVPTSKIATVVNGVARAIESVLVPVKREPSFPESGAGPR